MKRRRSIRFRLTAWYALLLAGALILFALSIGFSMWRGLVRDVDDTLAGRIQSVESFLTGELKEPGVQVGEELSEYAHAFPTTSLLLVKDEHGAAIFESTPAFPWPNSAPAGASARWRGHDYQLLAAPIQPNGRHWRAAVAEQLDSVEHLQTRLWLLLAALSPFVIAIAAIGGSVLSRRALRPVDEITAAARTIGIENLSQRLVVPQSGDELQRLSETWNSMLIRLEDAVTRLRTFTADASHELRTPLAVIRSTAEIACRKERSAQSYRESLQQIVTESERMTQVVEDLLFLARCDARTLDVPLTTLELGPIVSDVCNLLMPLADARAVVVQVEQPLHALKVVANASALRRLILILVDNAIKFSREAGRVTVKIWKADKAIQLAVEDSGPGIPSEELPRIFDRFYRSPEASDNGRGAGLGLSLAAGIAEHHRARIDVASTDGVGSTFSVAFPVEDFIDGSKRQA